LDYVFIAKGGVKTREELAEEYNINPAGNEKLEDDRSKGNVVKAIIVRCRASKAVFAHSVPFRGAGEHDYVVNRVVGDIVWLGHTELALTGGNERSLQALIERVMVVVRVTVQQGESLTLPSCLVGSPPPTIRNRTAPPESASCLSEACSGCWSSPSSTRSRSISRSGMPWCRGWWNTRLPFST
jgi:hypothetical protein